MRVKFYQDNFNGRFTWSWVDGEYITEDSAEIEHYIALGIRHEEVLPLVNFQQGKEEREQEAEKEVKQQRKKRKKAD